MKTTNASLPVLVDSSALDADLCDGLAFDGSTALRLAVNSGGAGIIAGTNYLYASMVFWLDSTVSGGVYLLELGRTTGFAIGFHTDPVGNGNPAVCVAINDGNSGNAYAARFEVDLRSLPNERTLHSLEITYENGVGFTLLIDGAVVSATATGGTDNGIGSSSLSAESAIGGSVNFNTLRTRGALNASSVVGGQAGWPGGDSGSASAGQITGGIAYTRIELSPGVAVLDMPLINSIVDRIDTDNSHVNHATNGAALIPTATPAYESLIRFLLTDESYLELDNPIEVTAELDAASPTTTIILWNPSSSNFSCSNITPSESGVSSVKNYKYLSSDIPVANFSSLTIPAGGYIEAVIEHDNSVEGDNQVGAVSFASDDQDLEAVFSVSVSTAPSIISVDEAVSGGTIDLGSVVLGTATSQSFTINNDADAPAGDLELGTLSISGDGTIGTDPSGQDIAAGESATATVVMDTSSAGSKSATLTIPSNDPDTPSYTVTVEVSVTLPVADISVDEAVSGGTIDLGSVVLGTATSQSFTINNDADAPAGD
ncbi:MAG: hypothetical protein CMJ25_27725, partial [Phycisphaerae bacterium]|nr:hypothetical protein [Phycisphaerae bacterium]